MDEPKQRKPIYLAWAHVEPGAVTPGSDCPSSYGVAKDRRTRVVTITYVARGANVDDIKKTFDLDDADVLRNDRFEVPEAALRSAGRAEDDRELTSLLEQIRDWFGRRSGY